MEENDYQVQVQEVTDLTAVKDRYQVPVELHSCHTAIVDGYVIEGHVPAAEVERLLAERPAVAGLGVPGMPIGSPGMEVEDVPDQPYDVFAFKTNGEMTVFASYPK